MIGRMEWWIGLAALLAFSPVLGHGFVYDDSWTVVDNPWLERPLGELFGLLLSGEALTKGVPDATRPTMVLSLWLERRVFGLSPVGAHLVSLLLYGLTCFLATALATRLSRSRSVAAVAGMFFAFAPLHAEPVAAVNYREDLLCGAGVLAAWLCALGPLTPRSPQESWQRACLAAFAWGGALFAKESAVVLVLLLLLTFHAMPKERSRLRRQPRLMGALAAVAALWMLWRLPLLIHGDDIPLAPERATSQVVFRALRFEVNSVRNALVPLGWAPDHWRQPDAGVAWLAIFALITILIAALLRVRRGRIIAIGLAVSALTALPSSPLLRPVNEIADRYFFLSVFGGGLVWGAALTSIAKHIPLRGRRRSFVALVCLSWLIPTERAIAVWQDERTLWTAAVERCPTSPRAWAALARVHRIDGDYEAARAAVDRAIAMDSRYPPALVTRIYNEIASGDLERARQHLFDLDGIGLHGYRGVRLARRCAWLDPAAARACIAK